MRDKDQEIQDALIGFAAYLDTNTKLIAKCNANIESLKVENERKEEESRRKNRLYKILDQKSQCIIRQKRAVQKYYDFLDKVREQNSDEFAEVSHILDRYKVLTDSQAQLKGKLDSMDEQIF